jgi:hypothetical protein
VVLKALVITESIVVSVIVTTTRGCVVITTEDAIMVRGGIRDIRGATRAIIMGPIIHAHIVLGCIRILQYHDVFSVVWGGDCCHWRIR